MKRTLIIYHSDLLYNFDVFAMEIASWPMSNNFRKNILLLFFNSVMLMDELI